MKSKTKAELLAEYLNDPFMTREEAERLAASWPVDVDRPQNQGRPDRAPREPRVSCPDTCPAT